MSTGPRLERLSFNFPGTKPFGVVRPVLEGVVGSGQLEVLLEQQDTVGCAVEVTTSARGFGDIWEAVLTDFAERHGLSGVRVSINDMGATPAVVSLRLDQAVAALERDR